VEWATVWLCDEDEECFGQFIDQYGATDFIMKKVHGVGAVRSCEGELFVAPRRLMEWAVD
jgi:hypothetical protein